MSLIDEALKRARQEAARQGAAEREARYARVPVYVPPAPRSRAWVLPVVVAVCLAAGIAGGLLLARPGSRSVPGSPPPASSPVPPAPTHAQAVVPEPGRPLPLAPSPARPPAPAPSGRGGTPAQGLQTPPREQPRTRESREPTPAPSPPPRPAPAPTPPADSGPVVELPQAPPAEPVSYVRQVPLQDGGSLQLNGIAFSSRPVALFGDKVVAPGESIGGFTVVAIEAQRVKLQGSGRTVYVTLK